MFEQQFSNLWWIFSLGVDKSIKSLVLSLNFLEWRDYMLHYDDVESKMLLHSDEQ